jgi:hypothetical protein
MQEISRLLATVNRDNFIDFCVDQTEVGKFSLYHLLLQLKKIDLNFSEQEWRWYLTEVKNSLLALFAVRKYIAMNKPDVLVTYNSMYPVNHIVTQYAEMKQIRTLTMHAGQNLDSRLQYMMLGTGTNFDIYSRQIEYWPRYRNLPSTELDISRTVAHFKVLLQGASPWAFSAAQSAQNRSVIDYFSIPDSAKIMVATMSSYDERFSAEAVGVISDHQDSLLFKYQVDWIAAVCQYVSQRPDLYLIIRVHPREFIGHKSDHAKKLELLFKNLPDNIKVNWPDQNISIFDLASYADVFLNAWSSAGKEMAALGLPVVLYSSKLIAYPAEFNYLGDQSTDDYFARVEQALADGWSGNRMIHLFRWYALEHRLSLVDLSRSYPKSGPGELVPELKNQLNEMIPDAIHRLDCYFREDLLPQQAAVSAIFEGDVDSVMDIKQPPSGVTEQQEKLFLARHLQTILPFFAKNQDYKGHLSLYCKLQAFIDQQTNSSF